MLLFCGRGSVERWPEWRKDGRITKGVEDRQYKSENTQDNQEQGMVNGRAGRIRRTRTAQNDCVRQQIDGWTEFGEAGRSADGEGARGDLASAKTLVALAAAKKPIPEPVKKRHEPSYADKLAKEPQWPKEAEVEGMEGWDGRPFKFDSRKGGVGPGSRKEGLGCPQTVAAGLSPGISG